LNEGRFIMNNMSHYIVQCVWPTWTIYHVVPMEYAFKDLYYQREKVIYKNNYLDVTSKVYDIKSPKSSVSIVDYNENIDKVYSLPYVQMDHLHSKLYHQYDLPDAKRLRI
jgi:hypothetical protein